MGRRPIGHSKGDAFAIAEAYKRKKRQEMLRDEDVTKAKNITKIINEPDSKPVTKKIKVQCTYHNIKHVFGGTLLFSDSFLCFLVVVSCPDYSHAVE